MRRTPTGDAGALLTGPSRQSVPPLISDPAAHFVPQTVPQRAAAVLRMLPGRQA